MIQLIKRYTSNQDGASAVEFALLAPFLIVMLVGTYDFGIFIKEKMQLQNTAQVVAQYIAKAQDDSNAQVIADEVYSGSNDDLDLNTEFFCECSDGIAAECPIVCNDEDDFQRRFVTVSVSGNFEAVFPYPGIPDEINMESSVRVRVD